MMKWIHALLVAHQLAPALQRGILYFQKDILIESNPTSVGMSLNIHWQNGHITQGTLPPICIKGWSSTKKKSRLKGVLQTSSSLHYGDREPTSKHDAYLEFCALLQSTDGQKHHKDHKHKKHPDTLTPKTTYSMVSKQCLAKLHMNTVPKAGHCSS